MQKTDNLTRRERQVLDIIYEMENVTAKEVQHKLPNAPSYSAVRAVLTRLVDQGHLKYREIGPRYIYTATEAKNKLRKAALKRIMDTFFDGSPLHTMNALLGISADQLSREELDELAEKIAKAAEKNNDS